MARMRRPGWNACEEFRELEMKKKGGVVINKEEKGHGEPVIHSRRIKTLARATKNEIPAVKAKIRSMLPMLQSTEVRRYKIPHYKSVILELEEGNLWNAANYIRRLLQLDKDLKVKTEPETIVQQETWLKNQKDLIDLLRDGLAIVDLAKQKRELVTEAAAFLETALSFESKSKEWWWIAEELYKSALEAGSKIRTDDGQTETISCYLYGKFLLNKSSFITALKFLNVAWNRSQDKTWNVSKILGTKQRTVFKETCMLLYKAYLTLAKKLQRDNPEQAVETCVQALEKAQESDSEECVAEALYELGKCELIARNTKKALHNFSKYLALVKRLNNPEGLCNAHMQLAFSYKQIGEEEKTMKHFRLFKDFATEFQLPYKLAQAHYFTGEHLLNQEKPELATPHLELSVSLYSRLNAIDECNNARCLAGVSKGQEIMKSYVKLILDCGEKHSKALAKLCDWKINRKPFWEEQKYDKDTEEVSLNEIEDQDAKISKDSLFPSFSTLSKNAEEENQESKPQSQEEETRTLMEKVQSQEGESNNSDEKIHHHE